MRAEWARTRLGAVCSIDRVQGVHSGLPYVGLENIAPGTGEFVDSAGSVEVKSNTFRFSPEHVLYGRLRPYLNKVMLPDFEGRCSTEIFPIKPGASVTREFLQLWMMQQEIVDRINATCTGTRMPRANLQEVLEFEFSLPPLDEQRRIVAILEEAFDCVAVASANAEENAQSARALFESYRESLLADGSGWARSHLADLCDIKHGYAFRSEFFVSSGGYTLLTPGNFNEAGGYRNRGEKQKFYDGPVPHGFVLSEGDLLVAMTEQAAGLLGSPILVPRAETFLHNQRLGLVVARPDVPWLNQFFFHVFNTERVRRSIREGASGVKVRHTSPKKIGMVEVAYPTDVVEQERIARALSECESEAKRLGSTYERKSRALASLRESLLHGAFSGNL